MSFTPMNEIDARYLRISRRNYIIAAALIIISVVVAFFAILCSTYTGLSVGTSFEVLMDHLRGEDYGVYYFDLIVWDFYVPRSMGGVIVGAGLAVGGCIMQAIMRNPLADPYTTGVASGASFGAALFITMDFSILAISNYQLGLTTNAIIFSVIPTVAIIAISKKKSITPTTMILAGIAIMYVFRASTSLMVLLTDAESVETLYKWNVGTLNSLTWDNIWTVMAVVAVCSVILMYLAHDVTLMTSGENNARAMGVRTKLVRVVALAVMAIMTAVIVGYTGTIGFMGLIAPHVARMFVGSNLKYLIPTAAGFGALILVVCDLMCKMLFSELLVGVITSIIGGPLFIILLLRGVRKVWY